MISISWWLLLIIVIVLLIITTVIFIFTRIGAVVTGVKIFTQELAQSLPPIYWSMDYDHLESELKSESGINPGQSISYKIHPIVFYNDKFRTALESLCSSLNFMVNYEHKDLELTATIYFTKL